MATDTKQHKASKTVPTDDAFWECEECECDLRDDNLEEIGLASYYYSLVFESDTSIVHDRYEGNQDTITAAGFRCRQCSEGEVNDAQRHAILTLLGRDGEIWGPAADYCGMTNPD